MKQLYRVVHASTAAVKYLHTCTKLQYYALGVCAH